jgi:hypothetical protein
MAYAFKVTVTKPINGKGEIVSKGTTFHCSEETTILPTIDTLFEAIRKTTGIEVPTSNIDFRSLKIERL